MRSIATFLIPITIIGLAWLPGNFSNLADRGSQRGGDKGFREIYVD